MFQGKLLNFRNMMRSPVPTKRTSRIFDIGDLRSGHFRILCTCGHALGDYCLNYITESVTAEDIIIILTRARMFFIFVCRFADIFFSKLRMRGVILHGVNS